MLHSVRNLLSLLQSVSFSWYFFCFSQPKSPFIFMQKYSQISAYHMTQPHDIKIAESQWSVCHPCECAVTIDVQHDIHQHVAAWEHSAVAKSTASRAKGPKITQ